jgi:hypothetical protein
VRRTQQECIVSAQNIHVNGIHAPLSIFDDTSTVIAADPKQQLDNGI